jgi:thiamine pyrophosphate-dependent acetolactate synthase large subunit-like protein
MSGKFTIGEFLVQAVKNVGVKSIFGIPGDMVIRFFKVIEDDPDLKLYTFSHEPGVGFAAVASARASRKPAVACITYGAGGLNMLNAVACAYAEKTPLIVISGGPGEGERVPLRLLIEKLLERKVEKKSLQFPPKSELILNRACKYDARVVTVNEMIDAINWFFGTFGEMPIISDTGDCLFVTTRIEAPSVMATPYYASMGFATPAAIGYSVTTGKRPLVLLGDGGFQMTGQEMCHCPRFGINPIFIVFNNKRWGMQQLFYPTAKFNELVNWSYSKMAELWGGKGYYCDSCEKLYRALEESKNNKEFSVIEAVLSREDLSEELLSWVKELHSQQQAQT